MTKLRKGYVDAKPIYDHILYLQSMGWSLRDIEDASGISRRSLQCILHGSATNPKVNMVRESTAESILKLDKLAQSNPRDTRLVKSFWFACTVDDYLNQGVELFTISRVCDINKDVLRQRWNHRKIEFGNVKKLYMHRRELNCIARLDVHDKRMEQAKLYMKRCPACGGTFQTTEFRRKYCSDKCCPTSKVNRAKYKRQRRKAKRAASV